MHARFGSPDDRSDVSKEYYAHTIIIIMKLYLFYSVIQGLPVLKQNG